MSIGTLRADLVPEFVTTNLSTFYKAKGVRQEFSARATPMQNGQVERANRSIGEEMKAMLLQSDLHNNFWAEVAAMFVYVHNLLPREHLGGKSTRSISTSRADPPIPGFSFSEQVVFRSHPTTRSK